MIGSDQSNPTGPSAFDPQQLFKTMQQAWQAMPMSASMAPAMDIGELDKRIAELRTIEQWLELNLNMLRASVQGLEVQRGTLATLKAFGESLARPAAESAEEDKTGGSSADPFAGFGQAMQGLGGQAGAATHPWWQTLQEQFQQLASAALTSADATPAPRSADADKAQAPDAGKKAAPSAPSPDGIRQGTRGRRRSKSDKS